MKGARGASSFYSKEKITLVIIFSFTRGRGFLFFHCSAGTSWKFFAERKICVNVANNWKFFFLMISGWLSCRGKNSAIPLVCFSTKRRARKNSTGACLRFFLLLFCLTMRIEKNFSF